MQSYIQVDKEYLHTLKINCKGKRTVEKANKRINIEKIILDLKFLKIKIKKKKQNKEEGGGKLHNSAELQKPKQRQRFITAIKSVIGKKKKKTQKLNQISQC